MFEGGKEHRNIVLKMHLDKQVTNYDLQQFKGLANKDLQLSSNNSYSFSDAVTLVSTNREYMGVNFSKMKQCATEHNLPMMHWLRKTK